MSNGFRSFFFLLGSKSEKCHLKGTIYDHNNCDCRRETKYSLGGIIDDKRDIIKGNIPFSDIIGTHSPKNSSIRSESMLRKKRCKNRKCYIEDVFHINMSLLSTKNNIWLDCIYFFIQSKFFAFKQKSLSTLERDFCY